VALLGPSNGNEYSGTADCSGVFCNTELAGFFTLSATLLDE